VNTALATLTGAVYYDSPRNDPDFFRFTPVSDRKSDKVSTVIQNILKAFRRQQSIIAPGGQGVVNWL
jgi:hypothetical protein